MDYYKVQEYASKNTTKEPKLLEKLYSETHHKIPMANMVSGHLQGRFLSMISKMIKPKNILEVGAFTGYSTICLAEGLDEQGEIYTIERNKDLEHIINKYLKKARLDDKINIIWGEALNILNSFNIDKKQYFDLVFIDADKKNYLNYYKLALPLVKNGGYIAIDNMLWHGKVLNNEPTTQDKKTKTIVELTDALNNNKDTEVIFLPIRDGITLIRKNYE